jgi:LysM repeat protein
LTQCKTTGKSYKDISYDPAKLKTPPGHGMERNDYPFDEQGNYRKDWVKSNASGRDRSAAGVAETAVAAAAPGTEPAPSAAAPYPSYAEAAAARATSAFVGPAGAATAPGASTTTLAATPAGESGGAIELASAGTSHSAAPAAQYHKVTSGDTLFSLASRYRTSVSELKRVNGLTGDSIRSGQSLRIP